VKPAAVRVGVGTRFVYDGEVLEVIEMHPVAGTPEVLTRDLRTDTVRRLALDEVRVSDRCHLLTDDVNSEISEATGHPASVKWAAVSEQARRDARNRAAHVRELLTGYRSGSATTASPREPRACYKSEVPKTERIADRMREEHFVSARCMTPKLDPLVGLHFRNVLGDAVCTKRGLARRLSGVPRGPPRHRGRLSLVHVL
jgi:hypothetical protein